MEIRLHKISYIANKKTQLQKTILKDITALIKNNQITVFLGPNGSGKTTLASIISLLNNIDSGDITYDNIKINNKIDKINLNILKPKIGFIYQNSCDQFFCNTVKEEIEFALDNLNYHTKDKAKRIKDSLKLVGLNPSYLDKDPLKLSNGEQKLLSIAITLSYNPEVIILDEPTLELDNHNQNKLIKLIKLMKLRYNKTIIVFTKDSNFAHQIADYIYILNNGSIIVKGLKYKIFKNEKLLKENNLTMPDLIKFSYLVETEKSVKIEYRDDINDLMKDIYRHVR